MPRFFFDISAGATLIDRDGVEFPDAEAARLEAIRALLEIALDELRGGRDHPISLAMRDAAGCFLFTASLKLEAQWLTEAH